MQLCADHSLCLADKVFLPTDSFTFVSSSHNSTSWLDHILITTTIFVYTLIISSDHLPLSFSLSIDNLLVTIPPSSEYLSSSDKISYNWYGASDNDINQYYSCSRSELARIKLPLDAMHCKNEHCIKYRHDIDSFYYSIINALDATMKQCIPKHKSRNKNCITEWNYGVSEFYDRSRSEFKWWVSNNRPRHRPIYHAMRSARAQFKYALRQCRLDERLISSNKLANHMQRHDINAFWKDIRKHTKSKAALSNSIDGITGEADIAGLWGRHYEQLLNDSSNESSKFTALDSFGNVLANVGMQVTMKEVSKIVSDLPNGKSSGFDGLNSESLKHADPLVCLLLSVCFTCMFTHCYMPSSMIKSIIVPLVKNKCGNLADKNNYRPIALSSIASKVFEHVILCRPKEYLWTNENQFGFKPSHTTDLCVYALTENIEYFKSRSTSIYVAFLDASKAFDKISHWTLFKKMIDRDVPIYLVKILCYWYQHQEMIVQWGSCLSNAFFVTNGVRQGGILSPMLFNIYIDGLSDILNKSTIGGSIGGNRINHMLYANDLCMVSLSSAGLQQLLVQCDDYCKKTFHNL